jgi:predicted secreted protein
VITNYTVTAPVDDVVTFAASLQTTGTITRATF